MNIRNFKLIDKCVFCLFPRKSALRLGTIARERSVQTAYPDSGTEEVQHPPASAAPGKEEEDMGMVVVQNS